MSALNAKAKGRCKSLPDLKFPRTTRFFGDPMAIVSSGARNAAEKGRPRPRSKGFSVPEMNSQKHIKSTGFQPDVDRGGYGSRGCALNSAGSPVAGMAPRQSRGSTAKKAVRVRRGSASGASNSPYRWSGRCVRSPSSKNGRAMALVMPVPGGASKTLPGPIS